MAASFCNCNTSNSGNCSDAKWSACGSYYNPLYAYFAPGTKENDYAIKEVLYDIDIKCTHGSYTGGIIHKSGFLQAEDLVWTYYGSGNHIYTNLSIVNVLNVPNVGTHWLIVGPSDHQESLTAGYTFRFGVCALYEDTPVTAGKKVYKYYGGYSEEFFFIKGKIAFTLLKQTYSTDPTEMDYAYFLNASDYYSSRGCANG